MVVEGLDGKMYKWPPIKSGRPSNASELHEKCRQLLQQCYPTRRILEEVTIPGSQLSLDFYLPHRRVAIEVQGQQHFKFVPHFHGNKLAFAEMKRRDMVKKEWCRKNGIELIELNYDKQKDWGKLVQ